MASSRAGDKKASRLLNPIQGDTRCCMFLSLCQNAMAPFFKYYADFCCQPSPFEVDFAVLIHPPQLYRLSRLVPGDRKLETPKDINRCHHRTLPIAVSYSLEHATRLSKQPHSDSARQLSNLALTPPSQQRDNRDEQAIPHTPQSPDVVSSQRLCPTKAASPEPAPRCPDSGDQPNPT